MYASRICLALVLTSVIGSTALATSAIVRAPGHNTFPRNDLSASALPTATIDPIREARILFAKENRCKDAEGVVDAVGDSGEEGAWQVISANYKLGAVPKDLPGQANQAETIIKGLLAKNNGIHSLAMAKYNGGNNPEGISEDYAQRVLARQQKLKSFVSEKMKIAANAQAK